jgi:hypothetical protein
MSEMNRMVKIGKYIIGAFGVLIVIGLFMPSSPDTVSKSETKVENVKTETVAEKVVKSVWDSQASDKAQSYLSMTAFSRSGLIDQLVFEGFDKTEATKAVDSLNVNWNEQAVKKAESYLSMTSFSKSGLIEQLKFEGFTSAQAAYGVANVG